MHLKTLKNALENQNLNLIKIDQLVLTNQKYQYTQNKS